MSEFSEADLRRAILAVLEARPERGQPVPGPEISSTYEQPWVQLRQRVVEFADALREQGVAPAEAVSRLKDIVRAAAPQVDPASELMAAVSAWCIEAFFSGGTPAKTSNQSTG